MCKRGRVQQLCPVALWVQSIMLCGYNMFGLWVQRIVVCGYNMLRFVPTKDRRFYHGY